MTPLQTSRIAAFLAAVYPSVHAHGEVPPRTWHALLADVDATDALLAADRLARRRRDVTLSDIALEAYRIREQERRARRVDPDSGPDAARPVRAALPDLVAEMLALRVPCPWCGAAADRPCTLRGRTRPLRRTVAHPARLAAAGSLPVPPPPRDRNHSRRSGTGPAAPTDEKAPL
jgi:hypothetical protein